MAQPVALMAHQQAIDDLARDHGHEDRRPSRVLHQSDQPDHGIQEVRIQAAHVDVRAIDVWGAVFAVALGAASIAASKAVPAILLTSIAQDLGISEGVAGQTVTVTALVGLVASLLRPPTAGVHLRVSRPSTPSRSRAV